MTDTQREALSRTELLLGEDAMARLSRANVIVFGVGGVGGHALEALVRSGIGKITAVDPDAISVSNINRQLLATYRTVGMLKVEAARERMTDISPSLEFKALPVFYTEENADLIDLSEYDYIIDAIDTVKSKLLLCEKAYNLGVPIISSMGAGNKLDPTAFRVSDVSKTSVCPLARVMRAELKRRGIKGIKCVWSDEAPTVRVAEDDFSPKTRHAPANIATVPSVAGLIIASEVIKDLCAKTED